MKKLLRTSLFLLLTSAISIAQTTSIPDANFEQALIDLGYDTAPIDGVVTTANISSINSLDVSNKNIADITGIEDFISLTGLFCNTNQITTLDVSLLTNLVLLYCGENQISILNVSNAPNLEVVNCISNLLTTLDVSQNANLIDLNYGNNQMITAVDVTQNLALEQYFCYSNNLTSIDVSQNLALFNLGCWSNLLNEIDVSANTQLTRLFSYANPLTTNLDLSNNPLLERLWCFANGLTALDVSQNTLIQSLQCGGGDQITSLDLSQHTALTVLNCGAAQLTELDLRNGTNTNITSFNAGGNPDLFCIFVDDVSYSSTNWIDIDAASTFVEDQAGCDVLGVNDFELANFSVYPNPVTNKLTIKNNLLVINKIDLYDMAGKSIQMIILKNDTVDVSHLTSGVYILRINTDKGNSYRRILKK